MKLELEPGWKRAFRRFFEKPFEFKPGDIVPKAWLEHELGVPHFDIGTQKQHDQAKLHWFNHFEALRAELLDKHQLWLERDKDTDGYRVLVGSEHYRYIQDEGQRRMVRANKFERNQLANVRIDALTAQERAAHAESLARNAQLQAFLRPKQLGTSSLKKSKRLGNSRKDTE